MSYTRDQPFFYEWRWTPVLLNGLLLRWKTAVSFSKVNTHLHLHMYYYIVDQFIVVRTENVMSQFLNYMLFLCVLTARVQLERRLSQLETRLLGLQSTDSTAAKERPSLSASLRRSGSVTGSVERRSAVYIDNVRENIAVDSQTSRTVWGRYAVLWYLYQCCPF